MKQIRLGVVFFCWFAAVGQGLCGGRADIQIDVVFEEKYQAWKAWVLDHRYLSSYTTNKEFQELVNIGAEAVPLLIEKMEDNQEDFHLEVAVYRITKRRFDKAEWPEGKRGDAKTAAKMYVKWWKEDRATTADRASELYDAMKRLKKAGKEIEAGDKLESIVDLGVDVLPFLVERVDDAPDLLPAIVKLSGGKVNKEWDGKECKKWLQENRSKVLPPSSSSSGECR